MKMEYVNTDALLDVLFAMFGQETVEVICLLADAVDSAEKRGQQDGFTEGYTRGYDDGLANWQPRAPEASELDGEYKTGDYESFPSTVFPSTDECQCPECQGETDPLEPKVERPGRLSPGDVPEGFLD